MAGRQGVECPSVRPIHDLEERMFRAMIEPFDQTAAENEQEVTKGEGGVENSESDAENHEKEAIRPKTRAPPKQPSTEEVENHMVTHLPFRDWCPHCVRGKSGSKPHRNMNFVIMLLIRPASNHNCSFSDFQFYYPFLLFRCSLTPSSWSALLCSRG